MNTILEIQKLDAQKRKCVAGLNNSKESKLLDQFTKVMKEGKNFVSNVANTASEMIAEYNEIAKKYEMYFGKAQITEKQSIEKSDLESLSNMVDATGSLASDCAFMEQRMRELTEKSSKLLNDYNIAMNQLKDTKKKVDALKEMISKMQENLKPQLAEIDKKIASLEPKADKDAYETYKRMLNDNIFPVYVKLNGNRCGGCQMELPLSFIDKLKLKGTLPCEECRRIIIFE